MTDRYSSLTVILERDIREDDATPLIAAISQLRGVARVEPHISDANLAEMTVRTRMTLEIQSDLRDLANKLWSGSST